MIQKTFLTLYLIASFCINAAGQQTAISDTTLMVGFNNGHVIYPHSIVLKEPMFKDSYLLVDKSDKYSVESIKFYQDKSGYYIWTQTLNYNYVRLKRAISGKISTYSRIVNNYSYNPHTGVSNFGSAKLEYFQVKKSGLIQKINYENLHYALGNNPESMQKLKEVNKLRVLNMIGIGVGSGLLIGGIAHMYKINEQDGPPPYDDISIKFSPLFFAGAATLSIPLFTMTPRKQKMREAIEIYNR